MMNHLRKAFTLIELMVVVTIIVILASLAVPSFVKYREASLTAKCVSNLRGIQDAREAYYMDHVGADNVTDMSAFLRYFGEVTTEATAPGQPVLVDADLIVCPYNGATYAPLTAVLGAIGTMPVCPNQSGDSKVDACAGHVYSAL